MSFICNFALSEFGLQAAGGRIWMYAGGARWVIGAQILRKSRLALNGRFRRRLDNILI